MFYIIEKSINIVAIYQFCDVVKRKKYQFVLKKESHGFYLKLQP